MQPKNSTIVDFARRTDALASRLRLRLGDLPAILGMSRASLFNYRSGKAQITDKAWRKLERSEREAGIAKPLIEQLRAGNAAKLIQSASLTEMMEFIPEKQRLAILRKVMAFNVDTAEIQILKYLKDAEALAQLVGSKKKRDHHQISFFAENIRTSFRKSTAACQLLSRLVRQALDLEPELTAKLPKVE